jgi:hypothetical protein
VAGFVGIRIHALEVLESRGEKRDFSEAEAKAIVLRDKPGRPTNDEKNADDYQHYPRAKHNSVDHVKDRLRRDNPDLAARVERGELTANAAAVLKGWRKKRTPFDEVIAAWKRCSAEERDRVEGLIAEWRRNQKREAAS